MRYCTRCVMPDTRPGTHFDQTGVCLACRNHDKRSVTDWESRFRELEDLCARYRRIDGYYDCLIAVSGGKDSYFITHLMKEKMRMNPLLVCVGDPFTHTSAGTHNLKNIGEAFGCDTYEFKVNPALFRCVTKIGFEELGEPLRFIEAAIYTVPNKVAVALNIPLIVFGENAAFTYGAMEEDGYSAQPFIEAGHSASGARLGETITAFWEQRGLPLQQLNAIVPPSQEDLERVRPEPIFMGYYVPWDDERNHAIARRYGFRDLHHEWRREGYIESYGQIDSEAYLVHLWLKYPKFGFSRTTDIASRWIRKGRITRDDAIQLVMENDHRLDQRSVTDFCQFMGYTRRQFSEIVDGFWNRDLFRKVGDLWRLKDPIYADILKEGTTDV